ncbi:group II intron maturase-specific domain-containing protein [Endozoicomonas acroporae]|uniref:group II intron maturase-specific domain-containing protein n=1 Tax=Endozoicomonas acroporae TaxID=1701104 RepID=UPI003B84812E
MVKAYFDIAEILSPLRDLDKWIRRRLRCYILKQWGSKGYLYFSLSWIYLLEFNLEYS